MRGLSGITSFGTPRRTRKPVRDSRSNAQILVPRGMGKRVAASAQHGHEERGGINLAGFAMVNRNLGSGPVHEQLFAGPMLLAQDNILRVLPSAVQLAEAAVAIAFRFLGAVLLPEQLQREMFVLLQLTMQRYKIGNGTISRPAGRPRRVANSRFPDAPRRNRPVAAS